MKKALSLYLVVFSFLIQPVSIFPQKSRLLGRESKVSPSEQATVDSFTAAESEFGGLNSVAAYGGVLIRWQMNIESNVLGYYIHRVDGKGDNVINPDIVLGSAARAGSQTLYGEQYAYVDRFGTYASAYYLEGVDMKGNRFNSSTSTPIIAKRFPVDVSMFLNNGDVDRRLESQTLRSTELSIPKEVATNIAAFAPQADSEGQKYVVKHAGARIDVKTEGIYRVTFSQLQAAGFDVNAPKANWQLFLNGVEQAININEIAGYVEFYGKGIDKPETDIQGYFLIVGDNAGRRIQPLVARPSTSTVVQQSYNQTFQYKERINYLNQVLNGPAENYWGKVINATTYNSTFDLRGIDFNVPNSTVEIKIQGFSSGSHTIRPTLNGQVLDNVTGVAQFPLSVSVSVPTSLLKDASLGQGTNTLNLAPVGAAGDTCIFDTINISFARKPLATQNILKAYALNNKKSNLNGFTSANVRVFDISNESDVREMTNLTFQDQGGTFGTVLPAARGKIYYAVEDSAIKSPFAVVNNDGQALSDPDLGADLVIIAYKSLLNEAQAWANYRTLQGFSVKVVNVDEIYNEYNFGALSSDSIESFLDYAYHSWSTRPGYVLLIGDASYDSRNYEGVGFFNFVPTRIVTTVFTETGSDESLADFDNDGLAELAIGRIPARSGDQVTNALAKVMHWEANLPADPLNRGFQCASDWDNATPGDPNDPETLFQEMCKRLRDELPQSTPITLMNDQANTKSQLIASINTGKFIVNYSGHGSLGSWATTWFTNDDVPFITNHDSESIFTMLTCLNGYFLHLRASSLAELLLNNTNGGAVAAWSSTGLTTPDVQEVMARRFYNRLGGGTIPRMGDLIKDAKSTLVGGTDVRLSWGLIGDPMLKVR